MSSTGGPRDGIDPIATRIDKSSSLTRAANEHESVNGFRLDVIEGECAPMTWSSHDDRCTIGINPSCDLVLSDPTVSRFHCEIRMESKYALIRDLGSSNGTILDGTRIREAYLKRGSLIRMGRSVVRFDLANKRNPIPLSPRTEFGTLVGRSAAMRSMFAILERAARTDTKVLLEGETGTGKSATARSIHMESRRRDGPFVMLDCGSIPANLLESELFGHVRGAFTGANDRTGAFEEASGGTLFLDEIGELPAELQPKLLTALDDNLIRRVGESRHRKVDVRVITATNRDLRAEVNAGRFREDLYYRIAVVKVTIPPLRNRPDDIPALVQHLLENKLGATDEQIESLVTEEFLRALSSAAWPGNIRELRNYVEQCLVFDNAMPISPVHHAEPSGSGVHVDANLPFTEAKQQAMAEVERVYVMELLRIHNNKVARAAQAAGIDRTYFYRLLRRHGIEL